MNDVFEVEEQSYMIEVGDTQTTVGDEVTKSDVQDAAKDAGIKKFQVEDGDSGEGLNQEDFPVQTNVRLSEYNENA